MDISCFDFTLPKTLIAQKPAPIRDLSKLMIVDRSCGGIKEGEFRQIINYFNDGDILVLNNTKVFPARITGKKEHTGGKTEVLLISQNQHDEWECLIKGHVRKGQRLILTEKGIPATITDKKADGKWTISFNYKGDIQKVIHAYGQVPLPPYIKRISPEQSDIERYQTVYAKETGAIAAPTAGLHFTTPLLAAIKDIGVEIHYITLHVGPGTFKPIKVQQIERHKMDAEFYSVNAETIKKIDTGKSEGRRIIAVGTTTTRVLETLYLHGSPQHTDIRTHTDLFITPPFKFNATDALITNFHLPRSTLLILVCAFAGYDLTMKAYKRAIENRFRFYSYGDAMLII